MTVTKPLTGPTSLDTILAEVVETLPSGESTTFPTPVATPDPPPVFPETRASVSRPVIPKTTARTVPEYALFIAIDWGNKAHDLWYFDPATKQRTHHELEHTPNALHAWLQDLRQRYLGQPIAVALEQKTGSLFNFLVEDDRLDLYPLNPVMVAQYRKAFHPSGAKDDPIDAELTSRSATQSGPEPTTSNNALGEIGIKQPSEPWHSSGFASCSGIGRRDSPMTNCAIWQPYSADMHHYWNIFQRAISSLERESTTICTGRSRRLIMSKPRGDVLRQDREA